MSDLTLPIKDGKVVDTSTKSTATSSKASNSNLDKDDFLQLLVAQMKYQDPLEPASNTEYISQLATFSELEQMQNMNVTLGNQQAFSLTGSTVIVKTTDSSGNESTLQGVVDFVTMSNNKTYLSINNNLYSIDDLQSVVGEAYIAKLKAPSAEEQSLKYDLSNQKNQEIKVSLGEDKYAANTIAVKVNGTTVSSDKLSYKDGVLTINKDALAYLVPGKYKVELDFNDIYYTKVTDKVTITVTDSKAAS